jgi:GR25 family glycosyltransferase involved in LPS biosynthesis
MKVFIIHTTHKKSLEYAKLAHASFENYNNWEPKFFNGVTTDTLHLFEKMYPLKTKQNSRAQNFREHNLTKYKTKKCCSYNHYILFKKCIDIDEPITVIEHDSHCIADWDISIKFDDILVLNADSAIKREVMKPIWEINKTPIKHGINDINFNGLEYHHDPKINGAHMMPGTAAYTITQTGAKKMISIYENIGWEQSDFIMNTAYVKIQTIIPELFTFKLPNLCTSHGKNLE